jgi:4-amino-4-deoxy-L-arabinose transferase-like glycosyltransferase
MSERRKLTPPRTMLGWLAFIWRRDLFPAMCQTDSAIHLRSILWLIILPAVLLYPTRSFHLLEPDEGRYAEIGREMLLTGDWIVPHLQAEPYLDKPPLVYWLITLSYSVFGISVEAARLVPALSIHATILLVYLLGRRSLGERAAWWGAMLLAVSPAYVGIARLLLLDGVLVFLVTAELLCGFEAIRSPRFKLAWWVASAIACGLGILTKGPVAILLSMPPLLAYRWLNGAECKIPRSAWALWLGILACINAPWYLAIYLRQPDFFVYFFWDHNIMRFLKPFDHLEPVWYYVPILMSGLLPATFLVWSILRYLNSRDESVRLTRTREMSFFLLAGAWTVFFFSTSGSKLPTYILPAFPMVLLFVGAFIAATKWDQSRWLRAGMVQCSVFLLVVTYVGLPWYANYRSPYEQPEVIEKYLADKSVPVICFPRHIDSLSFYLERDDLRNIRSKFSQTLIERMMEQPKTVVLFTHKHSFDSMKFVLPPQLHVVERITFVRKPSEMNWLEKLAGDSPWGLCDLAVIERR